MTAPIRHFAINADDMARAQRFYERIFGWTFQPWGPPGFYMIGMGADSPVQGSLQGRRELAPGLRMTGLECTFAVDDVEKVAKAVRANGGRILMERTVLTGIGELIFFQDPEGNVAGAMRYDEKAE
jgi:predicted enzyme related to lactoylglutathione lyase